ncbi:MAG: circadian clock KaiB family protein [Planctomycetes bacterium]|nr:circadian clock KaiB family protein [Planctomycetota bacterium]
MKRNPATKRGRAGRKPVIRARVEKFLLRLYVAGTSRRSRDAILRARELCAGELRGQCTLEVIDIYQEPARARAGQIVATPTLVRETPRPVRRLIGTPARSSRLYLALGFASKSAGQ